MAAPIMLCDTAGMSNDRWLECRMHGPKGDIPYTVGGSDVAAIFGVSPWTTPLELWMIKKGRMKPPVKANADQLQMGHLLEPIAAYWYGHKSGNFVYEDTGLYQHADHIENGNVIGGKQRRAALRHTFLSVDPDIVAGVPQDEHQQFESTIGEQENEREVRADTAQGYDPTC